METIYKTDTAIKLDNRITELEKYVIEIEGRTWLVSDSLIKRSITVWWHLIIAYLLLIWILFIIWIIFGIIGAIVWAF